MKATINPYVYDATTTKPRTMAAESPRVGRAKSLALWGRDRRGQSCVHTREIR